MFLVDYFLERRDDELSEASVWGGYIASPDLCSP